VSTSTTAPEISPDNFDVSRIYKPWPHQLDFHTSLAKYRLQVGSYGSGKSRPLLWEAVFHALEFPGSNSIILRKTTPDLKRTVIDKFESDIPRELYDYYHETDKIVHFGAVERRRIEADAETGEYRWLKTNNLPGCLLHGPTCLKRELPYERQCAFCRDHEMVSSNVQFGACERDKDVGKYLSTEYVYIGFEELGEFSFFTWDALAGRNRCPIPGSRPCMAAATNPMGIGWSWIKKSWVDKKAPPGMDPEKYDPADYFYIHSTVDQNPIYAKDKEYIRRLEASPLRDKIRWGKLDSVTGQYFDNWEDRRHVRPRSDFTFQYWQPVWIGWDYGFGHYACIVFFTKAILKPRWEGEKARLVNVTLREIILHENTPTQQCEALIASIPRNDEGEYAEDIESIHFSWERFNRTVADHTVADDVGDLLAAAGLPRPTRSNTDRVAGWTKMYELLDADEWFVLEGQCPSLVEAIPLLVRGDGVTTDIEDVIKPKGLSLNDDIGDACRYAIAGTLLSEGDKPEEEKFREKLAAIKDPMRRHIEQFKEYNLRNARERRPQKEIIVPSWMKRVQ
jgi:hypothetical protein